MPNIPLIPPPRRKEPQRAMNSIEAFITGQKNTFSRSKTHDPQEKLLKCLPCTRPGAEFCETPPEGGGGAQSQCPMHKAQELGPFGDATRKTGQSVTSQPHQCPSLHTQAHTRAHTHTEGGPDPSHPWNVSGTSPRPLGPGKVGGYGAGPPPRY